MQLASTHNAACSGSAAQEAGLPVLRGDVLDAARASGLLDRLCPLAFTSDEMAPTFPTGCLVATQLVDRPDQVEVGGVYFVMVDAEPRYVGRLVAVEAQPYALQLTHDTGATPPPVILQWDNPRVQLWRVTHYLGGLLD